MNDPSEYGAPISHVAFHGDHATFETPHAGTNIRWRYEAIDGRMYPNTAGEPVHQSPMGSYCLRDGDKFRKVLACANLLGAKVTRVGSVAIANASEQERSEKNDR